MCSTQKADRRGHQHDPEATLRAFADHGGVEHAGSIARAAHTILRRTHDAGLDVAAVTSELEREGVRSFCDS
jgi:hypothetical protein